MYFHMPGSMGINMPKMATAKVTNTAQDPAWYRWSGFDQPFTLDRRGGDVCCVLIVDPGRTRLWLLPQKSTCKRKRGAWQVMGLLPTQAWPETPQGGKPPPCIPSTRESKALQTAMTQLWPTALSGKVAHGAQETKGHPLPPAPRRGPCQALVAREQPTAMQTAGVRARSMAQAIIEQGLYKHNRDLVIDVHGLIRDTSV